MKGSLKGQLLHDTYRVIRKIAEGGMGVVYEAEHARLSNKRYAVKVLLPSTARVPNIYQRFQREAEIASALGHPNIVDVLDFYQTEDGQPYLVMEYLEGQDLAARLEQQGKLPLPEVVEIVEQVCGGLQKAHDSGVVHRDMKPENIFLARSGDGAERVKLLDFGISKIKHSTSIMTQDQTLLGTPYYMSPEQAEGDVKDIDHTTDIFAVGVIIYQCICGKLPFEAPTPLGVIHKVCTAEPVPLSRLEPTVHPGVDRVVQLALCKDKSGRPARIEEIAAALKQAAASQAETLSMWSEGHPAEVDVADEDPTTVKTLPRGMLEQLRDKGPVLPPPPPPDATVVEPPPAETPPGGPPPPNSPPALPGAVPDAHKTDVVPVDEIQFVESGDFVEGGDDEAGGLDNARTIQVAPEEQMDLAEVSPPREVVILQPAMAADTDPRSSTTLSSLTGQQYRPSATRNRKLLWAGGAGVLLLLGGLVVWLVVDSLSQTPTAGSPEAARAVLASSVNKSAAASPTLAPGARSSRSVPVPTTTPLESKPAAPATAMDRVRIHLRLSPRSARFYLDGKPRRDNPLLLARSTKLQRLRVEAPGYMPREMTFAASRHRALKVQLTPKKRAAGSTGRPARAARHPQTAGDWSDPFSDKARPRFKKRPPKAAPSAAPRARSVVRKTRSGARPKTKPVKQKRKPTIFSDDL